ncbi:MAG: hypothetical protein K2X27_15340 [Candidatus Obscuribacterales bacterium]|nr:hypothetical protein [Candidatus Obscuribacterales bacterium]
MSKVKRIRLENGLNSNSRLFGFTRELRFQRRALYYYETVERSNFVCRFPDEPVDRLCRRLLSIDGVMSLRFAPYRIVVDISPSFAWKDVQREIVESMKAEIFPGELDVTVDEAPAQMSAWRAFLYDERPMAFNGGSARVRIRSLKNLKCREYAFPLKLHLYGAELDDLLEFERYTQHKLSIHEPLVSLADNLLELDGVMSVKFVPHSMLVRIASAFDWAEVQNEILLLSKRELFPGLADLEIDYRTAPLWRRLLGLT